MWNDSSGIAYHKLHEETFVNDIIDGKVTKWYKEGGLDRQGIMRLIIKLSMRLIWEMVSQPVIVKIVVLLPTAAHLLSSKVGLDF